MCMPTHDHMHPSKNRLLVHCTLQEVATNRPFKQTAEQTKSLLLGLIIVTHIKMT